MECKVSIPVGAIEECAGFNRYIVECKDGWRGYMVCICERDLIDTLWNVKAGVWRMLLCTAARFNRYIVECKVSTYCSSPSCCCDLIDTLWNVKTRKPLFRISWYIVECKGELFIEICRTYSGFNRYIVECKEERDGSNDRSETDLIDTLWNVKLPGPGP